MSSSGRSNKSMNSAGTNGPSFDMRHPEPRSYGSSVFSCRCFFTCSHDRDTEGLRTIAKKNQRLGVLVDQLIVVFGRKKNDLIFLNDPFFSFKPLYSALAFDDQKGLGGLVVVHGRAITLLKVEHQRAKIVSFVKVSIPDFFFGSVVDLLIQTNEIHNVPPGSNFYRRLGSLVNPDDERVTVADASEQPRGGDTFKHCLGSRLVRQ